MKNLIFITASFGLGFLVGKIYADYKGMSDIQAEIDKIRGSTKNTKEKEVNDVVNNYNTASKIVTNAGYTTAEIEYGDEKEAPKTHFVDINAEEWATLNGLQKESVTLYKDGILADEEYEIVSIEKTVGIDNIDAIERLPVGEGLYIRNIKTGIDYELVRENRTYNEVSGVFCSEVGP